MDFLGGGDGGAEGASTVVGLMRSVMLLSPQALEVPLHQRWGVVGSAVVAVAARSALPVYWSLKL